MIDGSAVQKIADLAEAAAGAGTKVVEIAGETYVLGQLGHVKPPKVDEPAALRVHTLSGVADYLNANRDALDLGTLVVQIAGHDSVRVLGPLTKERAQRLFYMEATAEDRLARMGIPFALGNYTDIATMLVALQAGFDQSRGDGARIREFLGSVRDAAELKQEDDGTTQTVATKAGVVTNSEKAVPNPVMLAPFRTFPEVPQPVGPFVLRLKGGNGQNINAALYEADGGEWKLAAVEAIRTWLREKLPKKVEIIG